MEKKGAGKDKNSIDRLLQDNNNLKNGLKKILQAFERDSIPMKSELTNVPDPNIIEKKTIQ